MLKKIMVLIMVASITTGCFGGFQATRAVYKFNKEIHKDKWVQEVVFLAMIIIPVYGIATLVDGVILNSVEFWSGKNPMVSAGDQKFFDGKDGSYAVSTLKVDGSVDIQVVEANGDSHFVNITKTDNQIIAKDAQGIVLAVRDIKDYSHFASVDEKSYLN